MGARTATPALAREINDRLALDLLIRHGPLSAPRLKELTGLSRPTVSDLLERLQGGGLVRVVGETEEVRRGPNAKLYGLVADHAHVAGVDIRHEGVAAVIADLAGDTVASSRRTFSDRMRPAKVIRQAVADAARRAGVEPSALHSVVAGTPGVVDPGTGQLGRAHWFPGWQERLLDDLRDLLGTEVVLENEVNLAAIAELHSGVAREHQDFVMMWLDRGVGGAVVIGRRLRRGVSGGAGEIGTLPVVGTGPEGLQDLLGADAVVELAAAHGLPSGTPEQVVGGAVASVADGARGAESFLDELAVRVALGAASAVAVLDPGLVVLAGHTGRAGGDVLAGRVQRHLATGVKVPVEVRPTGLPDNPILAGAVRTALGVARDEIFGVGGRTPVSR